MNDEKLDKEKLKEKEEEALDILRDIGVPFSPTGEPLGI